MFFGIPDRTAYDIQFQVLGFPVRVHPMFWLGSAICGFSPDPAAILVWFAVVFISILVHELGHALMIRRFGREAHIVLHMMGGLAIEGSENPLSFNSRSVRGGRTTAEQIYISLAGPVAGFLLAAAVAALVLASGGELKQGLTKIGLPSFHLEPPLALLKTPYLALFVEEMLYVNIFWGLLNLAPVYPLDGGQIARAWLINQDPWNGLARSLAVSIAAGAAIAVLGQMVFHSLYLSLLFASLAYGSYQAYQQISGGGRPW